MNLATTKAVPALGQPSLSAEQEMFRAAVRDFCARELPPERRRELTADGHIKHDPVMYGKLAELGWIGLTIPEQYGGSGGGLTDAAILLEEAAYGRLPIHGYLTTIITAQLIINYGTEEQKRTILPAVAQGAILAIAITEPDSGSDAASGRTRAQRNGEQWRIDGQKIFISNANHARWTVVVTKSDLEAPPHDAITLFALPMDRDGISFTPLQTLGALETNALFLDGVTASDEDIVGGERSGWRALTRGLNSERLVIGAESLGLAQLAFDDTLRYVKERRQFGRPVGTFQALAHGLAESATKLAQTRLLVYHTAAALDGGDPAPMLASMTKLAATELAKEVCLQGCQYLGGYGYMMEYEMQAYLRDSIVGTVFGGTSEIQKNIIAARLGLRS